MGDCTRCNKCISADERLNSFICELETETAYDRMKTQENKCMIGLQGVCCKLCSNGPCRITPSSPKGVCGATADVIVARNFLRHVAAGSGCYIHVAENAARNLKETALNKGVLKGEKTIERLCDLFEIEKGDIYENAIAIADKVLNDLYKPEHEKMELVKKLAYAPRYKKWEELNILPGGANAEIVKAVVKTSTNLNSDPVDMLVNCLKLGIQTGLYGLTLSNLLNDAVLGEPAIHTTKVGLRTIDEDYINVLVIGHQHTIFSRIEDRLGEEDVVKKAQAAGAKGFKIIGCTCVGQDMQLRAKDLCDSKVYAGHAGNNYASEAILLTGGIDAVLTEFNCALPGIEPICDELKIKQICLDDVAKKANAEYKPYVFATREKDTDEIVDEIIEAYKARRGEVKLNLVPDHGNDTTLAGLSEVTLKEFLGGDYKPLIDLIVSGKIKGVAAVVGCSNVAYGGHDVLTIGLTKELIKRDIIVLSAGCTSGGLENVGLMSPEAAELAGPNLKEICKALGIPPVLNFGPCIGIGRLEMVATDLAAALGIDIPQLPLVLSAPQWLEEQALADGSFGLALGLPLHLGRPPFVTGSKLAVNVLTEAMKDITGGHVILGDDPVEAAKKLEKVILEKRKNLNI